MTKQIQTIIAILLLIHNATSAQQLSPQTINTAGKSSNSGGILLEYSLGGYMVSTINTPTFMYTQDFLQPDAGSTTNTNQTFINDVTLDGGYGFDNAGTTFIQGSQMLEFTLGEVASITRNSANNMLTQGILQPDPPINAQLFLILYLEGYYSGGYLMRPVLYNQGHSFNQSITDTILVELRPAASPSTIAAQVKTLLQTNGNISCSMLINPGNYYIVIKHRNAIETWSAAPIAFTGTFIALDFSYGANTVYGNNQVEVEPGIWAMYSGDLNADENIDLLDLGLVELDISNFQFGYFTSDINGDGNVDLLDAAPVEANVNGFIFSAHP